MSIFSKTTKMAARSLRSPIFWMINLGAIVVCVLSGPFGTLEALPTGFRLIYWGLIVLSTSVMALWLYRLLEVTKQTKIAILLVVSLLFGLLVAGLVSLLSLWLLQPINRHPGHFELLSYSFPTAAMIFLVSTLVTRSMSLDEDATPPQRPALLDRLEKFPHAQQILSLSAQDHYVEVSTDIGTELCLIRLNDAIGEVAPVEGFQIHRSHWVAKLAVKKLNSKGATSQVLLKDGRSLNVSQSRLPDFKAFLKGS